MTLTGAGRRLHTLAREQLSGLQDFKLDCAKERPRLTLAAGDSIIQWVFLPKLPRVLPKLPNLLLRLLNLSSAEIAGGLAEGTVDIGLLRVGALPGKINTASLGQMQFSLFVPSALVPGKRPTELTNNAIARLPIGTLEGEGIFRSELARLTRGKRTTLDIQFEFSSFPMLAKAVQKGVCAAILPGSARDELPAEEVIELKPRWLGPLSREIVMA